MTLKIYDVPGNEVATLINEYKLAETYEVEWDLTDLTSEVYFYQLLVWALHSQDGKTKIFIETKRGVNEKIFNNFFN